MIARGHGVFDVGPDPQSTGRSRLDPGGQQPGDIDQPGRALDAFLEQIDLAGAPGHELRAKVSRN